MKVEYRNRYNAIVIFEKKGELIEMSFETLSSRAGFWPKGSDKPGYSFIDPSGGPFITAQAEWNGEEITGTDMGDFHEDWKGMTINYITEEDKKYILHLNQWIKSTKTD